MSRELPPVDDEILFRVITGTATDRERDAAATWRRAAAANDVRYRDLELTLLTLRDAEEAVRIHPPPALAELMQEHHTRVRGQGFHGSRPSRVARIAGLAAVVAALLAVGLGIRGERLPHFGGDDVATGPGASRLLTLGDSTRVVLGPNSRLQTAVREGPREAWLEGRAEFTVAPQAGRSFVVHTAAGDAIDLATRFVVRATGPHLQLVVFEGRVAVSTAGGNIEARAGQMVSATAGRTPHLNPVGTVHSSADWVRAALVFENATVDEVQRVLEAHYGIRVRVVPALSGRTITAWFPREPTVTQAVTAICRAVGARCSVSDSLAVFSL